MLSFVDVDAIRPLQVVVDAANGMAGVMLPPVLEHLPQSRSCVSTSSRTARSRTTSRTRCCPRTASSSSRKTLEERADFGVAFDGDADRCFFVDDTGEFVPGDFVTALLRGVGAGARSRAPRSSTTSARAGRCRETIERAGGVRSMNRVGHAFIKQRMREEHAAFGGEVSAHYYFRDFSQADSGVVPVPAHARAALEARREALGAPAALPRALLHHRRDEHAGGGRRRKLQELEERFGAEGASRTSTGSRSTPTTGTSTCGPRTPSRCCASTSRRSTGADGAQARRGAGRDPRRGLI